MTLNMLVNKPENQTIEQKLYKYLTHLESKEKKYFKNYAEMLNAEMDTTAEYWNGVRQATLATINDLRVILGYHEEDDDETL